MPMIPCCYECKRPFAAGEPVYRLRRHDWSQGRLNPNLCETCAGSVPPDKRRTASHCEECGRTIFQQHSEWVRLRPLVVCTNACLFTRLARQQKAARAERRYKTRGCQYCGRQFVAVRADARTCSTRCRVALHRHAIGATVEESWTALRSSLWLSLTDSTFL
jgi:hypothetical protein